MSSSTTSTPAVALWASRSAATRARSTSPMPSSVHCASQRKTAGSCRSSSHRRSARRRSPTRTRFGLDLGVESGSPRPPSAGGSLRSGSTEWRRVRPGASFSYDPQTNSSRLELDELMFANGIAHYSHPEGEFNFVLVNEWSRYRITRLWLSGPDAGKRDVFYDNLPGYPDNLSWDDQEKVFWVGLVIPRNSTVDRLQPHIPSG